MNGNIRIVTAFIVVSILALDASAQVPQLSSYQGQRAKRWNGGEIEHGKKAK